MKKILFVAIAAIGLFACNNNAGNKTTGEDTLQEEVIVEPTPEQRLPWKLAYDSVSGNFTPLPQGKIADTTTAAGIIADINTLWPEVQAIYQKTSGDTIFVTIPDSEYLTQRMGSSGPASYITLVTYSLTELPGIRKVNFKFEEGDHATPGTYTRENLKTIQ